MSIWRSKRVLAGVAVVLALAVGGGVAYAATRSDSPPAPAAASRSAYLNDVAGRLGVDPTELTGALKGAALDRLDALVAAGVVSTEGAAAIRQAIEQGQLHLPRLDIRGPHALGAAAEYLGVLPLEILRELRDGKSLAQIAEARGKTVAGLEQVILDAAQTGLDKVASRVGLTKDEEQAIVEGLKSIVPVVANHVWHTATS